MARDVPSHFVLPLTILGTTSDRDYRELFARLEGDAYLGTPSALEHIVAGTLSGIKPHEARNVAIYLQSMATWSINTTLRSIDYILDDMVSASNLDLDRDARDTARIRVLELVGLNSLKTLAFVATAYGQHEKLLSETSVTVNVRPVFDHDNVLLAMTVWSDVAVEYSAGDTTHALELAADRNDLIELRSQIDKALERLAAVEKAMEGTGVRVWNVDEEEPAEEGASL